MRDIRSSVLAACAVGLAAMCGGSPISVHASRSDVSATQTSVGQRRALLIGVTAFLNPTVKVRGLSGPAHDVELMKKVLMHPLGVPEANIRTLVDPPTDPAKRRPDDDSRRPTRANIEREFVNLTKAGAGDQIVIFMAGHGSQQPANDDPADEEYDGFDEIFLPADIGQWNGSKGVVTNAIVDDDIRKWITDIRNTGASVWVIFDSCHSGTMTRGGSDEIERQAPMANLGVPEDAIAAARTRAARSQAKIAAKSLLGLSDGAGEIAAMYAADSDEKTIEKRFDPGDSPIQGLFTYTMAKVLSEVSTPITYRELARRVLDRYRAVQRFASTPAIEGGGLDREILGHRTWPNRPQMTLNPGSTGTWNLDAGTIQGLTPGSILEVFPPAGAANAGASLGHVKVLTASSTSAVVEPAPFGKLPAPAAAGLRAGSRARVVYYGVGDLRLRVALQRANEKATTDDPQFVVLRRGAGPAAIERALDGLARRTNGLAERVDSEDADWFVRVIGGDVVLVPAAGWQPGSAPVIDCMRDPSISEPNMCKPRSSTPARHFRLDDATSATLGDRLSETIGKIARVANLSRLANSPGTGVNVEFSVSRFEQERGGVGRPLFSPPFKDPIVRAYEWVEYELRNASSSPVDITLLYIDAAFGITPILPASERAVDNRLGPGETRKHRVQLCGCPLGWESTIAIGVEGIGEHKNFLTLAQDGIRRSAGAAPSPLQQLLESAAFGRGESTRGPMPPQQIDNFVVKVVAWRTEAKR